MKQHQKQQKMIRLGTHGEDYGSWMSNPVFYIIGGLLALSAVLASRLSKHIIKPDLVCMDTETVRFRRRRNDGAGPSGRPLPSGF